MAQNEFLQGEIVERFLVDTEDNPLQSEDGQIAFMTPTILFSIVFCPSITALSIAYCTTGL